MQYLGAGPYVPTSSTVAQIFAFFLNFSIFKKILVLVIFQEHVESGTTYQRNDYLMGETKQIPSQAHKNENSR